MLRLIARCTWRDDLLMGSQPEALNSSSARPKTLLKQKRSSCCAAYCLPQLLNWRFLRVQGHIKVALELVRHLDLQWAAGHLSQRRDGQRAPLDVPSNGITAEEIEIVRK